MDINSIYEKIKKTQDYLDNDMTTTKIVTNIKKHNLFKNLDSKDIFEINHEYFENLPHYEKLYQQKNEEYKQLISQFSHEYLELCDFYVGSELPRETYLDSKKDILELFSLFILFALWEPYINAYHDKYCKNN